MKRWVLFIIAALLVAIPASAVSIYKVEPTTDAEKAVGAVLEQLHAKRSANDARGASELYAQNAVMKFYWGSTNELKVAEGRMRIYIALSSAAIQKAELSDVTVKIISGQEAEATGHVKIHISAFGNNYLKEPEVKWQLIGDNDKWSILREEHSQVPAVRM